MERLIHEDFSLLSKCDEGVFPLKFLNFFVRQSDKLCQPSKSKTHPKLDNDHFEFDHQTFL